MKGLTERQWKGDSGDTRGRMFEERGSIGKRRVHYLFIKTDEQGDVGQATT